MDAAIKDLKQHKEEIVTIRGWVYNLRSSGKIYFLQIRDGSGEAQAVVSKNDIDKESWKVCEDLTIESSVIISGKVVEDSRSLNGVELQVIKLELIHKAEEYPISKKEHGPEFLFDHRHLMIRSPKQTAILRIRSEVVFAIQEFMRSKDFTLTHTPTFTPTVCEGTTDLFEVPYFDKTAYLTQNGQLYLEALALALGKVYDLNPNFRAEKSKTRRHLTEFWCMNPEAAFMEHEESMDLQEELIVYLVKTILARCERQLKTLERDVKKLEPVAKGGFPRLTYRDAVKKLQELGSKMKEGDDLGAEEETLLGETYDKPVFVERWPKKIKPFYMKTDPDDPTLVLNNDLYAPEGYGELIGGSQREDDFKTLKQSIIDHKLPLKDFEWYLDLRRYGSVPHSGFGLGIERFVTWICGRKHVREAIPFPRTIKRLRP